jgi:hypothetical protein
MFEWICHHLSQWGPKEVTVHHNKTKGENSRCATEKYNSCALCHWKLNFELYAIDYIF